MSRRRQDVLKDRKLALVEKLISAASHQDWNLVSDLAKGFDLPGSFRKNLRPAKVSCDSVRLLAKLSRRSILRTVASSGDDELDKGLWESTAEEVNKGFLEGHLEATELPSGWLLMNRSPQTITKPTWSTSPSPNRKVWPCAPNNVASSVAYWLKVGRGYPARLNPKAKCRDLSDV